MSASFTCFFFPNGDPHIRGRIEIWIPIGVTVDRRLLVEAVARSINFLTFSGNIPICKRHRWRGLYSGLGAFILLDGLFGIGTELFKRFREKVMSVSARSTACSSAGHASPSNSSSVVILPLQGDSQHNETTGAWQDDPEIHRTKGWSWLSSKPAAKTKIFRMCIDPMRQYQISKDKLASLNTNKHYEIQDVLCEAIPKGW